jgi:hypothetical protein
MQINSYLFLFGEKTDLHTTFSQGLKNDAQNTFKALASFWG